MFIKQPGPKKSGCRTRLQVPTPIWDVFWKAVDAPCIIPAHYEMFAKNSEDPLLFADYLTAKYPGINHWIGRHGEKLRLSVKE